jgi:SAM-dependent methyltransferase
MYEGLASVYDDIVGDPVHVGWAEFAHRAWSGDEQPVRRVLDVCCGTGRMSLELTARGYDLTGVDGSAAMVDEARRLLGPGVQFSVSVLPELEVDGTFDAAVCTFDSLNYLPLTDVRTSLRRIAERLRPGGWLVLDLHTEAMMRTIAEAPRSAARSGALDIAMVNEVDLDARTCVTHVEVVPDGGERFTETHVQHFFSEDEVRDVLAAAGLVVVSVTDDYTDEPVTPETLRSTWVVRTESIRADAG